MTETFPDLDKFRRLQLHTSSALSGWFEMCPTVRRRRRCRLPGTTAGLGRDGSSRETAAGSGEFQPRSCSTTQNIVMSQCP